MDLCWVGAQGHDDTAPVAVLGILESIKEPLVSAGTQVIQSRRSYCS